MNNKILRPLTPGAKRAGPEEYFFDLNNMDRIMGGPTYSTANGPCVEGDRLITALMKLPAGTESKPHNHPNEQWIFIVEAPSMRKSAERSTAHQKGRSSMFRRMSFTD
jgi:hypothetical protein